jgi:hypothetical protein
MKQILMMMKMIHHDDDVARNFDTQTSYSQTRLRTKVAAAPGSGHPLLRKFDNLL